jgi:hypothetical protein
MLTDEAKVRAQIDTESVRHVLLMNGGGSVALLALLPSILGTPLVAAVLSTLAVWLFGLTLAVTHSVLRRRCSEKYEKCKPNKPLAGKPLVLIKKEPPTGSPLLSIKPKEPWVCWLSWAFLWASIICFFVGGVVMVLIGFANLDALTSS